jgi:hypothetical protein
MDSSINFSLILYFPASNMKFPFQNFSQFWTWIFELIKQKCRYIILVSLLNYLEFPKVLIFSCETNKSTKNKVFKSNRHNFKNLQNSKKLTKIQSKNLTLITNFKWVLWMNVFCVEWKLKNDFCEWKMRTKFWKICRKWVKLKGPGSKPDQKIGSEIVYILLIFFFILFFYFLNSINYTRFSS